MGAFEAVSPGTVEAKVEHHSLGTILLTCSRDSI